MIGERIIVELVASEVTNLINELGPELFPDFEAQRVIMSGEHTRPKTPDSPSRSHSRSWSDILHMTTRESSPDGSRDATTKASIGGGSSISGHLPRNESFKNLSNFGFFASRPQTPSTDHSRSRPASRDGSALKGFSALSSQDDAEHAGLVSKRIRQEMVRRRRRELVEGKNQSTSDNVKLIVSWLS